GGDTAFRDPPDARCQRHPRAQKSGRCAADIRPGVDDARSEPSTAVRGGFKLSICLHGARERANDGHRRARPHVAVGPPSLATQITPDVGEVAMEKGNEIIDMAHTRRVLPSLAVLALLVAAWLAVVAATQTA